MERIEALNDIFDELSEISCDHVILVEGPKDRTALMLAGVRGNIMTVQTEGSVLNVAQKIFDSGMSAIILTDWDHEGERIAKELGNALSSLCVRHDVTVRRRLRSVCGNEIRDVESLPSFYSRLVTESVRNKEKQR